MAISKARKLEWFEAGAAAFGRACPGWSNVPCYPCPICLTPHYRESVENGQLTAEHVPPRSMGGRELVLTCKPCNDKSGAFLDADAHAKERMRAAMAGKVDRPVRVQAFVGDISINGDIVVVDGQHQLQIKKSINRPGTADEVRKVSSVGDTMNVRFEPFAELGARISWLRAGYLTLFAVAGYQVCLDKAMQIVREQIIDIDTRKMVTFTSEAPENPPFTERRIIKVDSPDWHNGWAVMFGRYLVHFPSPGDMTFYERMAQFAAGRGGRTTGTVVGCPTEPTFGTPIVVGLR